jgi:hypothetical protein
MAAPPSELREGDRPFDPCPRRFPSSVTSSNRFRPRLDDQGLALGTSVCLAGFTSPDDER